MKINRLNKRDIVFFFYGSQTNVLGTSAMLLSVNYYDEEGRIAKVYKQHYQSGAVNTVNYDEVATGYNFEGMLTTSTRIHHNGTNSVTAMNMTMLAEK